ncbi:C6 transcription factor, putative [Talaromyces stipitatus ATCC 10500]|uniref:C6 transcription factor, putative n=1 Tax=Talaromyces stipitatus (strain ATCC 10500 / CBS 375.48 / QM 6759 / NRRL 1006) TaxID=441959 RepID=B8LV52_TALSN|nr:C6 transcription factor, putative [Talaromyces stipitatus ATCC 10500]EED23102.1 C6 transcription factor, putative [Talaromyces stipitatus ATCC 10500]
MDDIIRPPERRASGGRDFQRAYKACLSCRQKKAKCDIGPAPPCARCRREQRRCVFSEKRSWARKPRSGANIFIDSLSPNQAMHTSPQHRESAVSSNTSFHPTPRESHGFQASSEPNQLTNSLMRHVVSSGNDALNLLFEAAAHTNSRSAEMTPERQPGVGSGHGISSVLSQSLPQATVTGTSPAAPPPIEISKTDPSLLSVWESFRVVKLGWFTAKEAVTFVDKFFENLSPLSPILTEFYRRHENHHILVTHEYFLCCTILMISSRYHVLPGIGGASRSFFIHNKLWTHCQNLIMRLMLGQERSSRGSIRTLGTIEALLLISEWHPRSLHFPPENDAWDSDIAFGVPDGMSTNQSESSSNQWLQDVIEPARRSDQMSWMLLGSAFSLAHELGIFEPEQRGPDPSDFPNPALATHNKVRKQRVQQLLYVYINQLASRIGCMSLMPQSLNRAISKVHGQNPTENRTEWTTFMDSWMDLTKLTRSVNDMLFPSASFAKQQIHSGRYIGLLDHFRPLLTQWHARHLDAPTGLSANFVNILHIEYHYVRVYTHSFGMQAVVERVLADTATNSTSASNNTTTYNNNNNPNLDPAPTQHTNTEINLDPIDHEFIQEVIDGSCQILKKVIELAQADKLRFSPVRIFLRVTSSSIFLLKALSLGVRHTKLQESLDVLEKSIQALRSNILDDVHLASRYAILLEVHLSRLRRNLVASSSSTTMNKIINPGSRGSMIMQPSFTTTRNITRPSSTQPFLRGGEAAITDPNNNRNENTAAAPSADDNEWLFSLPFDPSMAPFGPSGGQLSGFDGGTLDFLWNLPE